MKLVTAYRANKILYNFIKVNNITGKVILPANICTDVVNTLRYAGLKLEFVDIQTDNLCIDQEVVLSLAKAASMLLFVHTYGIETNFYDFFQNVRDVNASIVIVDDKCLCMPDLYVEESPADLVLYSTGAKKMLDLGGGAIGYVADKWEYDEIRVGSNEYLNNEMWVLDTKQLYVKIDVMMAHKEKLNAIYRQNLPQSIQLPAQYQHWRFNILTDKKDEMLKALFAEGLFASSHYKALSNDCIMAQNLYEHVLNLFNDQYYTDKKAIRTCELINNLLNND
jgi:dTDP-4-amino-4,6-dideoxygalactose transaminase